MSNEEMEALRQKIAARVAARGPRKARTFELYAPQRFQDGKTIDNIMAHGSHADCVRAQAILGGIIRETR